MALDVCLCDASA
ncbi:hypothetical protein RYY30_003556 [Vibrio cholerae]|uniref:Uncharacterized protein n=1 Tax=Vibrio paracholerae TaxID=650003 RepID=A0AAX1QNT3_9VIBR|nr:hypothetical protein [Vibrio cholerae]QXC56198.1 hypothetical protein KSS82_04540 [Vibrio mimicus]RBM78262.1 hypothetical protein DLR70_14360 [Vibrio paracholerae]EGQ9846086.1 hypothetical protein [Vibrio cholerae]EGR0495281.1 hypothetical protein [Vibrio cholerae]